jgi:rubredoxin
LNQTNHFFNLGYGWLCKHCSAEKAEHHKDHRGRLTPERDLGKKESRQGGLALAHWSDVRRTLTCPHCGIEELINKS